MDSDDSGSRGAGPPLSGALARALGASSALLERLPMGVYSCDLDGYVVQHNRRAAELWGVAPNLAGNRRRYCGANSSFVITGEPLTEEDYPVCEVLRTGEPVRDREIIIEQPDGRRVTILANAEPLFDEAGALIGAVNCIQDITNLRTAERQVREGGQIVTALIDALPAAIYTTTPTGEITFYNKSAVAFWGRAPKMQEDRWCGSLRIYSPDGAHLPHDQCPMAQSVRSQEAIRGAEAMAERPDGARVPFLAYPTPIFDAEGVLVGAVNMLVDITERKAAEVRQKVLIDELNHRVKNTLATVQSMAAQCLRGPDSPGAGAGEQAFLARLMALSRTHDLLARESWVGADVGAVLACIAAPHDSAGQGRIVFGGPPVRLRARAALTLALTLNELATNAAKYGALSTPSGQVLADWRSEDESLFLSWRERGGPRVSPPQRRGFGTRMIERGIEEELAGQAALTFEPAGFECRMRFPLEPVG